MADEHMTNVPLFKANKRRRVFRKRPEHSVVRASSAEGALSGDFHADADIDAAADADAQQTIKRPSGKRHGIAFSSTGPHHHHPHQHSAASGPVSLAPHEDGNDGDDDDDVEHGVRFVRPMGKVVVEDRHLTAYVDSKMAELRAAATVIPPQLRPGSSSSHSRNSDLDSHPNLDSDLAPVQSDQPASFHNQHASSLRSSRTPRIRPRPRGQPDPSTTARNQLVDEILRESSTPSTHYDRSSSTRGPGGRPAPLETDEAAAEAFRADFLAHLAQRRRRRGPQPSSSSAATGAAGAGDKPALRPKLGGSRSQREKMRALEQEKKLAGTGSGSGAPRTR